MGTPGERELQQIKPNNVGGRGLKEFLEVYKSHI